MLFALTRKLAGKEKSTRRQELRRRPGSDFRSDGFDDDDELDGAPPVHCHGHLRWHIAEVTRSDSWRRGGEPGVAGHGHGRDLRASWRLWKSCTWRLTSCLHFQWHATTICSNKLATTFSVINLRLYVYTMFSTGTIVLSSMSYACF